MATKTIILIPTYNEGSTIIEVVTRVLMACAATRPSFTVMVLDDSSPDGTAGLVRRTFEADARVQVSLRPRKEGLGAAYADGFRRALELEPEEIATLDGDLSHDPEVLPQLLASSRVSDLAIGSRYVRGGSSPGLSFRRRVLSRGANLGWRPLSGHVRDMTSGFRSYRARALREVLSCKSFSSNYAFLPEIAVCFLRHGFRVTEVPICFRERRAGASKVTPRIVIDSLTTLYRSWRRHADTRPSEAGAH